MTKDGTATQQDVQTSVAEPGTSETYTKSQVDQMLDKVRSDSLAELGRIRKASEEAIKKATETAGQRVQQLLKEREEAELELVKDEPEKLTSIKARQEARRARAEREEAETKLAELQARLTEKETESKEAGKARVVQEIASKHGLDAATLTAIAKYTDGSADSIEAIAKTLPKAKKEEEGSTFVPDSNRTRGGSPLNLQKVRENYANGRINTSQYVEQLKALGVTP